MQDAHYKSILRRATCVILSKNVRGNSDLEILGMLC